MHLFGCKFSFRTESGDTIPDRKNFDSLLWAIVTVFQVGFLETSSSWLLFPYCLLPVDTTDFFFSRATLGRCVGDEKVFKPGLPELNINRDESI